jgi:hypothetical protein
MNYPPEPEHFGKFKLWPPDPAQEGSGWGLSWNEMWLSVILADRDACILFAGLFLGDAEELMQQLNQTYNRARPSVNVTVAHIFKALGQE